jgi:pimeloyl-ACP methyl ester carboxylesterase
MRHLFKSVAVVLIVIFPTLAWAEDKFFDSNGVRLRYVEQGTGDPIILVPGYTSSIERGWIETGVMGNLAKDHRVIALDNRGNGKSGKPHDPKSYGNEMSEDIVRLLDHLQIQRAHIVGFSMGGRIVAKLLTTHPERFLTATLGGSAGYRNWNAENDRAMEIEAAETERGQFRALIVSIAPTDRPMPTEQAIRQRSQEILDQGNDPIALAALVRNRRGLAVSDAQIAAVRVPTLAVVGNADSRLAEVNQLKKVMPSLKVVVVPNAVHSASDERGTQRRPEFVNAIREFIAAQRTTASR